MPRIHPCLRPLRGLLALALFATAAGLPRLEAATIQGATPQTHPVSQYTTFELALAISGAKGDPFDQRQAALDLLATAPSGRVLRVPGFYQHEIEKPSWRMRFTPQEAGTYSLALEYRESGAVAARADAGASWAEVSQLELNL